MISLIIVRNNNLNKNIKKMKNILLLLLLSLLINLVTSKRFKNKTYLGKIHNKKNNTLRTFLITTELNKTEFEKLLSMNGTLIKNETLISEMAENDDFPDEIDIEIEDEIIDNGTNPELNEFLAIEKEHTEAKSFLSTNNDMNIKKSKFGKFLPIFSLILFIYAMIYFNKLKKNKKVVKTYKLFDFDFKEEGLIVKDD